MLKLLMISIYLYVHDALYVAQLDINEHICTFIVLTRSQQKKKVLVKVESNGEEHNFQVNNYCAISLCICNYIILLSTLSFHPSDRATHY